MKDQSKTEAVNNPRLQIGAGARIGMKIKRRDRHGRGIRGPVIPAAVPAWRTRADIFDDIISYEIGTYRRYLGKKLDKFDFAVLDVPQNDLAPWEDGVPLGRFLPFERPAKIHGRLLFYRLPIMMAARREPSPSLFIHGVVTNQIAAALDTLPEKIDYLLK
ncbi:metallopeptidase family protein [Arcanobacterium hippocoleae]